MKISEIFYSLQGEGFLAGVPSIFIRLAGCPVKCTWCDTKYAWDRQAGQDLNIEQIIRQTKKWDCSHIVITGGEPFIEPDLAKLTQKLKAGGKHITIETVGMDFIPDLECDLMSISPKLSNSGQPNMINTDVLNRLIASYDYQLKFVIDNEKDLLEVDAIWLKVKKIDRKKVMLMPQAAARQQYIEKAPLIAELCMKNGFIFSPRLHILLWNNQRGR